MINIEYETKRKFYYYSDDFIDSFKVNEREIPKPLERLWKILDNKYIFLDYLTSKTLSFIEKENEEGKVEYVGWWKRLRNTKLGGIKADEKLLRKYNHTMDKRCVQKKIINAIASAAVYDDKVETGFVEDISDFLADISDNKAHRMMRIVTGNGDAVEEIYGGFVADYLTTKNKKEMQLRNRKKSGIQKKPLTDEVKQMVYDLFENDFSLRYIAEDVGLEIGEVNRLIMDYKRDKLGKDEWAEYRDPYA